MKTLALRALSVPRSVVLALQAALLLTFAFFATGCGALSAMANPKVAWALQDPAPMDVVVRRADAAEATGNQVDRLLCATPANADSDWIQNVGPSKDDSASEMKALADDPAYKASHARVVAAEVWAWSLGDVSNSGGDSPNLLTLVSPELGDKYEAVMAKKRELGDVQAKIATEQEAADQKGVSAADKKEHKKAIAALEKQADAIDKQIAPLQKAFLKAAKELAAKSQPDVRDRLGAALVNLRQAVDDAEIANGAAAVRYPLAVTSTPGALKAVIPVFVADIIEEQTGHRPTLSGFHPDVALDGMNVKLTINGLSKDDLGNLSIGDLTSETIKRSTHWLGRVAGLIGVVAANKETLSFEGDTLDAILDGFKAAGWKRPAPTVIPEATTPAVASAKAHAPRARKAPHAVVATAVTGGPVPSKGNATNAKNAPSAPSKKGPAAVAAATVKSVAAPVKSAVASASPVKTTTPQAPAAASADAGHLQDDRAFATQPRSVSAIQGSLAKLLDARDHASDADRPAAVLRVADAYMELDYAASASGDKAMAASARQAAIDAYEEARATHAPAVDATALFHLAVAYDRDGNTAQEQKVLSEIQRRWPGAKVVARAG